MMMSSKNANLYSVHKNAVAMDRVKVHQSIVAVKTKI